MYSVYRHVCALENQNTCATQETEFIYPVKKITNVTFIFIDLTGAFIESEREHLNFVEQLSNN